MAQHLSHVCDCGRVIHWPKEKQIGDVWVCRWCGCENILSTHGDLGTLRRTDRKGVEENSDYLRGGEPARLQQTLNDKEDTEKKLNEKDSGETHVQAFVKRKKPGDRRISISIIVIGGINEHFEFYLDDELRTMFLQQTGLSLDTEVNKKGFSNSANRSMLQLLDYMNGHRDSAFKESDEYPSYDDWVERNTYLGCEVGKLESVYEVMKGIWDNETRRRALRGR